MTTTKDVALTGLTSQQAAERLAANGPNELPAEKKRNLMRQAWDVVREPMLLLLLAAGCVNFLSEPLDGAILMSFVVVVIAISIYQEHKTENALAALRDLSSPRALVVRDGRQVRIAGRDVVRGDVVLLAEGDRVPADATLADCENFSVDESALTGESVPVRKAPATPDKATAGMGRPGGGRRAVLDVGHLRRGLGGRLPGHGPGAHRGDHLRVRRGGRERAGQVPEPVEAGPADEGAAAAVTAPGATEIRHRHLRILGNGARRADRGGTGAGS